MKSNYKKLGQYIQPINIRNKDLKITRLLGVSIKKVLMPSIANTVGTNMKTYKIIKKHQFAYGPVTSRNGDKISIALLEDFDEAIISQAYVVFEIIDTTFLNPEYLMMWFRRPEFDRYARFKSHGSARETFDWDELCDTELPVPTIEKQNEIVKEYNTVVNRIKLNEQLNQKLEETAQALYKHWFVDFEFPNAEGKPYKSSGGKMVYNDKLDGEIPEGWEVNNLSNIAEFINGFSYKGDELKKSNTALVTIKNFSKKGEFQIRGFKEIKTDRAKESHFAKEGDVIVAHTDLTKGIIISKALIILDTLGYESLIISMDTVKVISTNENISNSLLYHIINDKAFKQFSMGYVNGSTVLHLSKKALPSYRLPMPKKLETISLLSYQLNLISNYKSANHKENAKLVDLKELILSQMSKVETKTAVV